MSRPDFSFRPYPRRRASFENIGNVCGIECIEGMEARFFLARHRPRLIEIAKGASPALQGDTDLTQFLEEIYRDFDSVPDKPGKRESLPGEDVFWWCVTILEELEEVARPGPKTDPYLLMMIEQLQSMGSRLERSEPLPSQFGIHWFNELDDIWDEENLGEHFGENLDEDFK